MKPIRFDRGDVRKINIFIKLCEQNWSFFQPTLYRFLSFSNHVSRSQCVTMACKFDLGTREVLVLIEKSPDRELEEEEEKIKPTGTWFSQSTKVWTREVEIPATPLGLQCKGGGWTRPRTRTRTGKTISYPFQSPAEEQTKNRNSWKECRRKKPLPFLYWIALAYEKPISVRLNWTLIIHSDHFINLWESI